MRVKSRIWEIDFIRGIAIVLMIIFHLVVDLRDYYHYDIEYLSGFWYYVGKTAAILFMLVSGVSSTLSKRNIKRGAMVFGFGMLLTVITYYYNPELYIRFGILHFLGLCMILSRFLKKIHRKYLVISGTVSIVTGLFFDRMIVRTPYLFPIGLMDKHFDSLDYYPLFPWLGVFLYGMAMGHILYKTRQSLLPFVLKYDFFSYLGRHSLLIYLIHQPILLGVLYLFHP